MDGVGRARWRAAPPARAVVAGAAPLGRAVVAGAAPSVRALPGAAPPARAVLARGTHPARAVLAGAAPLGRAVVAGGVFACAMLLAGGCTAQPAPQALRPPHGTAAATAIPAAVREKLAASYLVIANAGNHRLEIDFDGLRRRDWRHLAAAKA